MIIPVTPEEARQRLSTQTPPGEYRALRTIAAAETFYVVQVWAEQTKHWATRHTLYDRESSAQRKANTLAEMWDLKTRVTRRHIISEDQS